MSNSAIVTVNSTPIPTTGTSGINVTSGSTITVALANNAGVQSWSISCTGVDEITSQSTINNSLVQTGIVSATFTMPSTSLGAAMQFTSITNQGYANQNTFIFGVFVQLDGYRLFFNQESNESNATVGNCADLNKVVRGVALGGGGGGGFSAGGDLTGTSTSQTVVAVQGHSVASTSPSVGQFLIEGSGSTWKPTSISGDITASTVTPGQLTVSEIQGVVISGAPSDGYALIYSAAGTAASWSIINKIDNVTVSGVPTIGQIITSTSSTAATWQSAPSGSFSAGGDLTGSSTNQTVASIQGIVISGTPSINNVLIASSSSAAAWGELETISGVAISATAPTTGYVLTATSSVTANWQAVPSGSFSAGGDLSGTSTLQTVIKLNGNPILNSPSSGYLLFQNAANTGFEYIPTSGDITTSVTTAGKLTVASIQGVVISGTPTNGQVLTATSGTAATWATGGGGGSVTWAGDLAGSTSTSQSVVSLTGSSGVINISSAGNILTWAAATTAPGVTQTTTAVNSATAANMTIQAQSASGTTSVGGNLVLEAGTGTSTNGIISMPTSQINNQIAANQGTTTTILHQTTTSGSAASAVTVFTIPSGSNARVDVTITGRQGALAVNQTWSGKLYNNSGTVVVYRAFAPVDALDASSGVSTLPTLLVANSGAAIQVTVTPNATFGSTSTSWTYATCAILTS